MMNLAELWNWRDQGSNPCRHIKRYAEISRDRFLSDEELSQLGVVLEQIKKERSELECVADAIRLLLFTGCRLNEVLALTWDDINFDTGELILQDSKTGRQRKVIGTQTIAFLTELKTRAICPWVIPNFDFNGPLPDYSLSKA